MIKIEKTTTYGWEESIRGMRNPLNSWDKSDSKYEDGKYIVGDKDLDLMLGLAQAGSSHSKYRRMLVVYVDITAPLYWWKEFDTYKVGTVANSCSTMHKITAKKFEMSDFSTELMLPSSLEHFAKTIDILNIYRQEYKNATGNKREYWDQLIQLLPSSYNQKRTVMLNYEVLANIYHTRKDHKLKEWRDLCDWAMTLPHSELIKYG